MKMAVCACREEYEELPNRIGGRAERPLQVVGRGVEGAGGGSGGTGWRGRGGSGAGAR